MTNRQRILRWWWRVVIGVAIATEGIPTLVRWVT